MRGQFVRYGVIARNTSIDPASDRKIVGIESRLKFTSHVGLCDRVILRAYARPCSFFFLSNIMKHLVSAGVGNG